MSLSSASGTGQTLSGTPGTTIPAPAVSIWSVIQDEPGETIYKNISGGLDQPNKIRLGFSSIADVFKGTEATPVAGQRTNGYSILVQVTEVWKVTESTTGAVYYLPVSAHSVYKLPSDVMVTSAGFAGLSGRLMGATLRSASENQTVGLGKLLQGVTRLPDTV